MQEPCVEDHHILATLRSLLNYNSAIDISFWLPVDEGEMGVRRFMREVVTQWRSLSMEVRSVRSMLEEVLSNWERYGSTVASLQAWLEDAEEALNQPEKVKQVCLLFCICVMR